MNVLIALLGRTPGVVTGTYYALTRDRGTPIDRVVTVSTRSADAEEGYVLEEFDRWRSEGCALEYGNDAYLLPDWTGNPAKYREEIGGGLRGATRVRIPFEDVNEPDSVDCFRELLRALLTDVYREAEVHVSIAGGRKSMAAIATLAAQLYGYSVKGLYHLYVKPEIPHPERKGTTLRPEEHGTIQALLNDGLAARHRLLRPEPGDCSLVPISFFQLTDSGKLALRGEMQAYLLEYLDDNKPLLQLVTASTNRDVIAYLFEEKVADHLRSQGWTPTPRARMDWFGDGDFDVWAESADEVLICECKHQDNEEGMVEARKFKQAQDRLKAARQNCSGKRVTVWVVSNAREAEPEARKYMLDADHPVEFRGVRFRRDAYQRIQDKTYLASLREPWLEGEFEVLQPPDEVTE